jgi:Domain of unknown function (DUF4111)
VPAIPPGELPPLSDDVVAVADALRSGLDRILGENFAGLFLYGAVAFPHPEPWRIDFDFHVLLERSLTDEETRGIRAHYTALASVSDLGADLDGYFVLLADAARPEPPRHQLDAGVRDEAWALHRAHVRAGRYFLVAGLDPRPLVPEPSWPEIDAALRSELAFIETHPHATAFGILNGARILCSFETRDVVLSKYQAGAWALAALPAEWHEMIRAAMRWYGQAPAEDDTRLLEESWAPFVELVRGSLPAT